MDEHTSHETDASSEPGGADEVRAARGSHGAGTDAGHGTSSTPADGGQGVGVGAGEPSTFEPEEDPDALPDDES